MKTITKNLKWIVAVLICLVILVGSLIYIAAREDVSGLASGLLQILSLLISSSVSIFGGHLWAQRAAKPHAESAIRRLRSLHKNLNRAANYINYSRYHGDQVNYQEVLALLDGIIFGQLDAVNDALKDWSTIATGDEMANLTEISEYGNITEENNG